VLGQGSLTVMPPSKHVSGKHYRWLRGHGPDDGPLAHASEWVSKPIAMKGSTTHSGAPRAAHANGESIPQGQRNDPLFRLAAAMRRHGCDQDEVFHALSFINQHRCRPPLGDCELNTICQSAMRYWPTFL
jgi:hypothetical protein